jgi:WD40 repeat protein
MSSEGEKFRVLIPTTAGAVEVLLLTEEDPVIARSVACIGGTTETADIDTAYDAFVSRPTGVVARLFGHLCYRLDVSGRIDAGSSWQLGVLTAHALHAAGRLAQEGQKADGVLWATGSVRAVDLTVGAVSHVPEKLVASRERLRKELGSGARVLMAAPAANAPALGCSQAAIEVPGATLLEVATVQELWDRLALAGPEGLRNAAAARRQATAPPDDIMPVAEAGARTQLHDAGTLAGGASRRRTVSLMAPEPPRGFVERHEQMAPLKSRLLDSKGGIVALRGAGGFGKTSLANHLCRDPDIRRAYGDGILHVELGEKPDNLVTRIADLVEVLTGERSGLQTVGALSAALGAALGEGRYLLVIDDVWREQDLKPFLQGGRNTTRLVTTRLEHVLPADAFRVPVDAMQGEEAVALLAQGLPAEQCGAERVPLSTLAARLGEWPLQLTLVNGFLRDRVIRGHRPLAQAIADVNRRLEARGLTAFDAKNDAARHQAVDQTLGVSLELLGPDEQARFRELAVFPEDTDVPVGICAKLWSETGGLDEIDTEDLLQKLAGHSLLLRLDLDVRTFRLHDVVRHYLVDGWRRDPAAHAMARLHARLIAALGDLRQASFDAEGERRYAYEHGAGHMAAAGQRDKLSALLEDPSWMLDKLRLTGPQSLISDYRAFAAGRAHELIGDVLDLSGRILASDPGQLLAQMLARLAPEDAEGLATFLTTALACLPGAALVPSRPTFTAPGAEVRRFEGHRGSVSGLAVLDAQRFVSCSHDKTLRLWDVESGGELRRFEGHEGPLLSLIPLDRRRVLSGSADKTIRLWDVETGVELRRFVGHEGGVTCLALLGGRVLSGSEDRTLRLWDIDTGQQLRRIGLRAETPAEDAEKRDRAKAWTRHNGGVTALAVVDGRILCGFEDKTLRLIDVEAGEEVRRFGDSTVGVRPILGLATLDESRFVAGGTESGTFCLWDSRTGRELKRFEGLRFWARAIAALDNRRVVVGTGGYAEVEVWDVDAAQRIARCGGHQTHIDSVAILDGQHALSGDNYGGIRLWDLAIKDKLVRFKGLEHWVASFAVLDDRRVVTGSWNGALAVWDTATGEERLAFKGRHENWVEAIKILDSGRVLTCGRFDRTIRLWDLATGEELRRFEGHDAELSGLAVVDGVRFLSSSHDKTFRLWHAETGKELRRFEGHDQAVFDLALVDNRRVLSAAKDRSVRLWDVETGVELQRFDGHEDAVYSVIAVGDRCALSGSADMTLRLWDLETGRELRRFEGHEDIVICLAALDGRHIVSGSVDRTVRLWDVETGAQLGRFDGDGVFTSLAIMPDKRTLLARDALARLHWIEVRLPQGRLGQARMPLTQHWQTGRS